MRACHYCKEQTSDDAIRCRYCSSWLDSTDDVEHSQTQTVVYVVDRELIRFAKFSISLLAIFIVIGAFLYGFDLQQASKEISQANQAM